MLAHTLRGQFYAIYGITCTHVQGICVYDRYTHMLTPDHTPLEQEREDSN